MKATDSLEKLTAIVRTEYEKLKDDSNVRTISTTDIAERAYKIIDPKPIAPPLAQSAAFFELCTIATEMRQKPKKYRPTPIDQADLFPGLQKRYSVKRHGELVDVLREDLTLNERRWIETQLRAEGNALIKHADALAKETNQLLKTGKLREPKTA